MDQTTRIHAPISTPSTGRSSWAEIARPQVHGYDLLNVVFVSPLQLASIADEKVLRVFDAPRTFVTLTDRLGVAQFDEEEREKNKMRPAAANVPPLGLSNKAVNDGDGGLLYYQYPVDYVEDLILVICSDWRGYWRCRPIKAAIRERASINYPLAGDGKDFRARVRGAFSQAHPTTKLLTCILACLILLPVYHARYITLAKAGCNCMQINERRTRCRARVLDRDLAPRRCAAGRACLDCYTRCFQS